MSLLMAGDRLRQRRQQGRVTPRREQLRLVGLVPVFVRLLYQPDTLLSRGG